MLKKWYLLIGLVKISALCAMLHDSTNNLETQIFSANASPKRIAKLRKNIKKLKGNPDKTSECSKLIIQLKRLSKLK